MPAAELAATSAYGEQSSRAADENKLDTFIGLSFYMFNAHELIKMQLMLS